MYNLFELEKVEFTDFLKIGLAIGTIIEVEQNKKARMPAYKLKIDFGDLGIKISSAQITENYLEADLKGKQIVAAINFPAKQVAGVKSEVLVLAGVCKEEGTILLEPSIKVRNGTRVL